MSLRRTDANRETLRSMWCTACRQDVPGLVDALDHRYCCPRCGEILLNDAGVDLSNDELTATLNRRRPLSGEKSDAIGRAAKQPTTASQSSDFPNFEPARPPEPTPSRTTSLRWDAANWELNEKLRHVERVTSIGRRRHPAPPEPQAESYPSTFEPPEFEPSPLPAAPFEPAPWGPQYHPAAPSPQPHPMPSHHEVPYESNVASSQLLISVGAWSLLGLAVGAFSCGGFLAAWGAIAERPGLQVLGMPMVLGGMVALLLGLLLQSARRNLDDRRNIPAVEPISPHAAAPPSHHFRSASQYSARRL